MTIVLVSSGDGDSDGQFAMCLESPKYYMNEGASDEEIKIRGKRACS